jgi:hypothetical protein
VVNCIMGLVEAGDFESLNEAISRSSQELFCRRRVDTKQIGVTKVGPQESLQRKGVICGPEGKFI